MPWAVFSGRELTARPTPRFQISVRARRYWKETLDTFELDDIADVELLREVVRTITRIDALEAALKDTGMFIAGSQGQKILNPVVAEIRNQQATLLKIQTALTATDTDLVASTTDNARKAARARWDRVGQAEKRALEHWQQKNA